MSEPRSVLRPATVHVEGAERHDWQALALCAQTDPELFYPDQGGSGRDAKRLCNGDPERGTEPCPVRAECLAQALEDGERFGVFGGLTERERRKLRKTA